MTEENIYTLREPQLGDVGRFARVLGQGATSNPDVLNELLNRDASEMDTSAVFGILLLAIADPQALENFYFALAHMWEHDPTEGMNIDEVPEEWDYEPSPALVEKGRMYSREEMWRSLTKRRKRLILKRYELEKIPFRRVKDMWHSISDKIDIKDFLATSAEQAGVSSGFSTTESKEDTDGPTEESNVSPLDVSRH